MSDRREELLGRYGALQEGPRDIDLEVGLRAAFESEGISLDRVCAAGEFTEMARVTRLQILEIYEHEIRAIEAEIREVAREISRSRRNSKACKALVDVYDRLMAGYKFVLDQRKLAEERAIRKSAETVFGKEILPRPAAIFDAATGIITFANGQTIKLGDGEKYVLRILVERRAASFSELQEAHSRPDVVLRRLLAKHQEIERFIVLPGGAGRGGYTTTLVPSEPTENLCRSKTELCAD